MTTNPSRLPHTPDTARREGRPRRRRGATDRYPPFSLQT